MPRKQIGVARKFVLPKDLLVDLRVIAAYRGEPLAETVRVALGEFVARQKRHKKAGRVA